MDPHHRPPRHGAGVTNVAILLFEEFDELGAVGLHEILRLAAARGCDFETLLVRLGPAERVEARSGLRVDPDGPLSAHTPAPSWFPGAGGTAATLVSDRSTNAGTIPDAVTELRCPELRQDPEAGPRSRYSTDDERSSATARNR